MKLNVADVGLVNDKAIKVKYTLTDLSTCLKKCGTCVKLRVQKSTNPSTIYEFNESSKRSDGRGLSSSAESSKGITDRRTPSNITAALAISKWQSCYNTIIYKNLTSKYVSTRESYNMKIINDILSNEATHIVSFFKEYLIYDDVDEFLKRFYTKKESDKRVKSQTVYTNKYSKVFPIYFVLDEKKYMFKNIRKKQKAIDRINGNLETLSIEESKLFTKNFINELDRTDSVLGKTLKRLQDEIENNSLALSYIKAREAKKSLQELVDELILEDTNLLDKEKKVKNVVRSKSKDFHKVDKVNGNTKRNKPGDLIFAGRSKSISRVLTEIKAPLNKPTNKLTRVQTVLDIKNTLNTNEKKRSSLSVKASSKLKNCQTSRTTSKPKLKGKIMKDQYFSNRNSGITSSKLYCLLYRRQHGFT